VADGVVKLSAGLMGVVSTDEKGREIALVLRCYQHSFKTVISPTSIVCSVDDGLV